MKSIALSSLVIWPDNYNEGDVGMIAMSIRRFGFRNVPKVWKNNEVRAGNHTVLALREVKRQGPLPEVDLSWPPRGVIVKGDEWFIDWIDISDLDENKALAFAIADNRAAARASQNEKLLAKYLNEIWRENPKDFEATGYDDEDLGSLSKLLSEDIDLSEFQAVNSKDILYRVVIDGMDRPTADELSGDIPGSRVEQYRV